MKFARLVFLIAGIYGLIVLLPQYFLEGKTGRERSCASRLNQKESTSNL